MFSDSFTFMAASSVTRYLNTYGSATRSTARPCPHSRHVTLPPPLRPAQDGRAVGYCIRSHLACKTLK